MVLVAFGPADLVMFYYDLVTGEDGAPVAPSAYFFSPNMLLIDLGCLRAVENLRTRLHRFAVRSSGGGGYAIRTGWSYQFGQIYECSAAWIRYGREAIALAAGEAPSEALCAWARGERS